MIEKIVSIGNMAVFRDFEWDAAVRDGNDRPVAFKPLNIIYGRNYSGKTTLSRIVRALETGSLSDKYSNPSFTVEFADGTIVDQTSPADHPYTVRAFNEDFVKSHLQSFFDEEHGIVPFAVLGEDNAELAKELEEKETALGTEETPGSLLAVESENRSRASTARTSLETATENLEGDLRNKANAAGTGIKHNKLFGNANYNISKIKADIEAVKAKDYVPLAPAKVDEFTVLLKEVARPEIAEYPALSLQYKSIAEEARGLLGRRIATSEPIQELLDDALLQEWVREGRAHHENRRETCAFCGNRLPEDLWTKLDKHFSHESEALRTDIAALISRLDLEIDRCSSLLRVEVGDFYATHTPRARELQSEIEVSTKAYKNVLGTWRKALESRSRDVFNVPSVPTVKDPSHTLEQLRGQLEDLRAESNDFTASLNQKQAEARKALRRHEVATFLSTIRYDEKLARIGELKEVLSKEQEELTAATNAVAAARESIANFKAQMKDERYGAEKVNHYLSHYFGHPALSLIALEEEVDDELQYRFEIHRDGARAYHLSEGERGLIAFCYFIARLDNVETTGRSPVIWIDDPASSLDDNHIFFIYSLIRSYIAKSGACGQLFVATHNLALLKYLKRLPHLDTGGKAYFLVHRAGYTSSVKLMPPHLKKFATEFHYLFYQIHRCAVADEGCDDAVDLYYNLGNNVRKFLEMYLFFRYPDGNEDIERKLERFFGNDAIAASLTNRVDNEYSHLRGLFERGAMPVDVPVMKQIAQFVLDQIRNRDPDQHASLLDSIGVTATEAQG